MQKQWASFLTVFFASVNLAGQSASLNVEEVVSQLQQRYDTLNDFSADFQHTYTGGLLSTSNIEHGVVHVKKPGRWRFNYSAPENKSFICNGTSIYSYFPEDQQVILSQLPANPRASTPALFLSGVGNLRSDFNVELSEAHNGNSHSLSLRLTPVVSSADYEFLVLTLNANNYNIEVMATTDFQGGVSTYTFANLQENPGLPDTYFEFDVPQDVEVITDDSFTR